jgi:hypothetical protein
VTGYSPADAFSHLQAANPDIKDLRSMAPRDWTKALESLDVTCRLLHDWSNLPFDLREDIEAYLAQHPFLQPVLVMAYPSDRATDSHVFATCNGMIVDTYTYGQIEPFRAVAVPDELKGFRVKSVVSLEAKCEAPSP